MDRTTKEVIRDDMMDQAIIYCEELLDANRRLLRILEEQNALQRELLKLIGFSLGSVIVLDRRY